MMLLPSRWTCAKSNHQPSREMVRPEAPITGFSEHEPNADIGSVFKFYTRRGLIKTAGPLGGRVVGVSIAFLKRTAPSTSEIRTAGDCTNSAMAETYANEFTIFLKPVCISVALLPYFCSPVSYA